MKFKIGFNAEKDEERTAAFDAANTERCIEPVESVVQVFFPTRNMTLAYYNDRFDLRRGDIVYVDGKLEGLRGHVVDVSESFKIKLSDYKRVIGLADTYVSGLFQMAGSLLVSFDTSALPFEKVITWFKAPAKEGEKYARGRDGSSFRLSELSEMKADVQIIERGRDYYSNNQVVYICMNGTQGRAIVDGTEPYELEFEYTNGDVRNLVCSCFCSGRCKHEVAAMLQLREALAFIEDNYAKRYAASGYFAAISKSAFFSIVIDNKDTGSIQL